METLAEAWAEATRRGNPQWEVRKVAPRGVALVGNWPEGAATVLQPPGWPRFTLHAVHLLLASALPFVIVRYAPGEGARELTPSPEVAQLLAFGEWMVGAHEPNLNIPEYRRLMVSWAPALRVALEGVRFEREKLAAATAAWALGSRSRPKLWRMLPKIALPGFAPRPR